jgi:hypothetical protein
MGQVRMLVEDGALLHEVPTGNGEPRLLSDPWGFAYWRDGTRVRELEVRSDASGVLALIVERAGLHVVPSSCPGCSGCKARRAARARSIRVYREQARVFGAAGHVGEPRRSTEYARSLRERENPLWVPGQSFCVCRGWRV